MMTDTTRTTKATRGDLTIRADWSEASSPIEMLTGDGDWTSTCYQVADARYRPERALDLVEEWLASNGG